MSVSNDSSFFKTRSVEEWKSSRRDTPEDIAEALLAVLFMNLLLIIVTLFP